MFDVFSLIVGGITILYLLSGNRNQIPPIHNHWTILLLIVAVIMIYLAPEGFDRYQYRIMFETPGMWGGDKDVGWETYNSLYRPILGNNSDAFFLMHDCLYTLLFVSFTFVAFRPNFRFYFLFLLVISLGYYSGGTNVMRTGLANAIMYFGMSRYIKYNYSLKGTVVFICLSILAVTIHASILLLIVGIVAGYFFPKMRLFYCLWFGCLILSCFNVLGGLLEPLIDYTEASGDRLEAYISQTGELDELYIASWRLDFVIYSAIPLLFAYYYINVCNYKNRFYQCMLCAYLVANSFWLCVIRMPFTDRVALISWCIIPIIITYPVLMDYTGSKIKRSSVCLSLAYLLPLGLCVLNLIR